MFKTAEGDEVEFNYRMVGRFGSKDLIISEMMKHRELRKKLIINRKSTKNSQQIEKSWFYSISPSKV